jgi:DNA helicase-2/ATP-dependent DNA helicase PcrA
VDELPEAHVDVLSAPGIYGGHGGGYSGGDGFSSSLEKRASEADAYNSPGWKRLQRSQEQPFNAGKSPVIDVKAVSAFTLGERVFHDKFGYGEVVAVDGDKVEVDFDKAGVKKVVSRFIKPAADADADVPF